jgi:RNA polymerase sigma-B factor
VTDAHSGEAPEDDTPWWQQLTTEPEDSPLRALAREQLVRRYQPLADLLARRYCGRGETAADLVQVAYVGLLKAINGFRPEYGVPFGGYAVPTILGELRRHFRDHTWDLRPGRRVQEQRLAVLAAADELTQQLGRAPTVAELASLLDFTEEEVLEAIDAANAYQVRSLDSTLGDDDDPLGSSLGAEDPHFELIEHRVALRPLLARLPRRQRRILGLRFFADMTQTQIAQAVGISQMQVSRDLASALATLRGHLSAT